MIISISFPDSSKDFLTIPHIIKYFTFIKSEHQVIWTGKGIELSYISKYLLSILLAVQNLFHRTEGLSQILKSGLQKKPVCLQLSLDLSQLHLQHILEEHILRHIAVQQLNLSADKSQISYLVWKGKKKKKKKGLWKLLQLAKGASYRILEGPYFFWQLIAAFTDRAMFFRIDPKVLYKGQLQYAQHHWNALSYPLGEKGSWYCGAKGCVILDT